MNKFILFNTAVGSLNLGDQIINESVNRELLEIIDDGFVAEFSTHTPVTHFYQNNERNAIIKFADSCKYKFIAGTNILASNNLRPWPNWNVNIFNTRAYKNSILVGGGSTPNSKIMNLYSRILYRNIFSKDYIHSTRDDRTQKILESLGLKAINTGCATLWSLDEKSCKAIPTGKSNRVVFTLTDYNQDLNNDKKLIEILKRNYKDIYYWPQGSDDLEYADNFDLKGIKILPPKLESYRELLKSSNVDFVGTRLHAGIFAMQNNVRSIIIVIDNRARDMQKTYNLNAIERSNIADLDNMINSNIKTNVNIDMKKISEWKNQVLETKLTHESE